MCKYADCFDMACENVQIGGQIAFNFFALFLHSEERAKKRFSIVGVSCLILCLTLLIAASRFTHAVLASLHHPLFASRKEG